MESSCGARRTQTRRQVKVPDALRCLCSISDSIYDCRHSFPLSHCHFNPHMPHLQKSVGVRVFAFHSIHCCPTCGPASIFSISIKFTFLLRTRNHWAMVRGPRSMVYGLGSVFPG